MSYNPAKRSAPDANGAEPAALSLERGSDMVTATVEAVLVVEVAQSSLYYDRLVKQEALTCHFPLAVSCGRIVPHP